MRYVIRLSELGWFGKVPYGVSPIKDAYVFDSHKEAAKTIQRVKDRFKMFPNALIVNHEDAMKTERFPPLTRDLLIDADGTKAWITDSYLSMRGICKSTDPELYLYLEQAAELKSQMRKEGHKFTD